ncbi:uncharacterized protein G2W53_030715 [Senna tora]|uniref:Uncharacterized protein n=1 Tax=Senna tora TaxID=362788 RepID=A0A834T7Z9_9FABA|nr:uncharacterized protein G2W53_030715 [Senna tora]
MAVRKGLQLASDIGVKDVDVDGGI